MSLIQTAALTRVDPLDDLVALQRHAGEVARESSLDESKREAHQYGDSTDESGARDPRARALRLVLSGPLAPITTTSGRAPAPTRRPRSGYPWSWSWAYYAQ
jgi:hypothetical protein